MASLRNLSILDQDKYRSELGRTLAEAGATNAAQKNAKFSRRFDAKRAENKSGTLDQGEPEQ